MNIYSKHFVEAMDLTENEKAKLLPILRRAYIYLIRYNNRPKRKGPPRLLQTSFTIYGSTVTEIYQKGTHTLSIQYQTNELEDNFIERITSPKTHRRQPGKSS